MSKPPRVPFVMGEVKEVYAELFDLAGGLMYDFASGPSVTFSL